MPLKQKESVVGFLDLQSTAGAEVNKPKVLLVDLEIFPNLGYYWPGRKYDVNIIKMKKYGGMASFAYKWLGEKKIHCETRQGERSDKNLVKKLRKLMDEADTVIAHNGAAFDSKTYNTYTIQHNIWPESPYKLIDTCAEARKHYRFDSNSLDDLAQFLGVGRKLPHKGFPMWEDCMEDVPAAWKDMVKYNKHDIFLLEGCYLKMRPRIEAHPNIAFIQGKETGCPRCGSEKLQSRGVSRTRTSEFKRYQCQSCGGWCRERLAVKGKKAGVV